MRKLVFAVLVGMICASFSWAVPTFTPVIDGTQDAGWGMTPDEATSTCMEPTNFCLNGLYVTDDPLYVYFGFSAPADPWDDGAAVHAHIEIDVGGTAGGGYFDQWGSAVTYSFPFQPEYDIITQWNTGHPAIDWTGLQTWDGSAWVQTQVPFTDIAGTAPGWMEIRIPRSMLGLPGMGTALHLSMWARPAWDKSNANSCVPAEVGFPSDWGDGGGHAFHNQFTYTMQTANGDVVPPQIISVHQIDKRSVELVFDEAMDVATLNQFGNYTVNGFISTGVRYAGATNVALWSATDFTAGTPYSVTLGAGIHDLSGNSIDPAHNVGSWNGVGYADVTFTVIDESLLQDQIFLKGSWNFYHEHDGAWSWGHLQMYDDGTHNDPVSGDHRFTLVLPLVPNGGSPEFQWGIEDEGYNWLLVGGNQTFTLSTTDPLAVSYTIPDATHNPVDVTFNIDMQFVTDPITGVKLMGTATNWGDGLDMTDVDLDGVWTATVTLPTGSQRDHEFKFKRVDTNGTYWESVGNRSFHVNDSPTSITLPTSYYENYLPTPTVAAFSSGSDVTLSWNAWPRVHFQILTGSTVDNISTVVTTVVGSSHTIPGPLDVKAYYQVKIVE